MNQNIEEQRAKHWLESKGYIDILDLSIANLDPPDFVVEQRIGVEVRRLNWMTDTTKTNRGVEELEKPLEVTITALLKEAVEPPGGYNVFLSCLLPHDCLPPTRVTRKQVSRAIDEFVDYLNKAMQPGRRPHFSWATHLKCGITIWFDAALTSNTAKFELVDVEVAASMRGWVVKDTIDNINRCIQDKTEKVMKTGVHRYPEWWLVLVDHNVFAPDGWDEEWHTIRKQLVDTQPWSRIVVLHWWDTQRHVEVI